MRTTILFALALLISIPAFGQYKKLLDTNYYWLEHYHSDPGHPNIPPQKKWFMFKGDSIIGGKNYKKLVCTPSAYYTWYFREDTIAKIVYFLDYSLQERVYFNFNKQVGDSVSFAVYTGVVHSTITKTVSVVDSVLLNDGLYHRRINAESYFFVEGVGNTYGGIVYGQHQYLKCTGRIPPSNQSIFGSCYFATGINENVNGNAVLKLFPNPSKDKVTIQITERIVGSVFVTDISGRKVMDIESGYANELQFDVAQLQAGMYVVNTIVGNRLFTAKFIKE